MAGPPYKCMFAENTSLMRTSLPPPHTRRHSVPRERLPLLGAQDLVSVLRPLCPPCTSQILTPQSSLAEMPGSQRSSCSRQTLGCWRW